MAKKKNKKTIRLISRAALLVILAAIIIYAITSNDKVKVLAEGDMAPDFELVDLEGNEHRLSDYKGQGVFLNFWGTWCPPCKKEMPHMEDLYKDFEAKGVHILTVNVGEPKVKIELFRDDMNLSFPMLWDKNKTVMDLYNIKPLPTTFLINPEGKITKVIKQGMTEQQIYEYLESIQPK
ncbi:thiol-disulfide oxidoreductase [Sporosarcina sp. P21c]|uniref:thiol-disulfide oxidoreductase ResA n=1 Tax=Sporosarcina TaxID=1569 RepID=UPI000A146F58|nr:MULTISPECIES: thiol-disulfide oxidoreductase ResA [Sporosarcina]ARJ40161.1 thiol-disulfide oxidoreductase [Sporosarcina ureae]PIC68639.1 thiol-disulfide oxidoreductase [Sporosarcina sp. P16a]PIC84587.1 thiol-disulfide oxidoreductase [Sporosarcina sp. P1]PIC91175.1 thiol-disulfide oxidoreductase [Sporosarcina sp. P21c]PIC93692.1 thiol-disulfide oxidoreductase [Sporosarcina sp. P25]